MTSDRSTCPRRAASAIIPSTNAANTPASRHCVNRSQTVCQAPDSAGISRHWPPTKPPDHTLVLLTQPKRTAGVGAIIGDPPRPRRRSQPDLLARLAAALTAAPPSSCYTRVHRASTATSPATP